MIGPMFLNFLLFYFKYDSVLKSVFFYSRSDAVSNVYISFDNYYVTVRLRSL